MGQPEAKPESERPLPDVLAAMPDLGPASCSKLGSLSIRTIGALLFACRSTEGRERVSAATGLGSDQLEDCRIAAELLLVPDLEPEWVPLLRAAGIDGLGDLACRHPTTLTERLGRLFKRPAIGREPAAGGEEAGAGTPGFFDVAAWIAHAAVMRNEGGA